MAGHITFRKLGPSFWEDRGLVHLTGWRVRLRSRRAVRELGEVHSALRAGTGPGSTRVRWYAYDNNAVRVGHRYPTRREAAQALRERSGW